MFLTQDFDKLFCGSACFIQLTTNHKQVSAIPTVLKAIYRLLVYIGKWLAVKCDVIYAEWKKTLAVSRVASHLDEAERVVLLHEAFEATADLLETGLVLADPGDVLLNCWPIGVTMSACAFSQSGDEAEYFGLHLVTQPGQALLRVVHKLLDEGSGGEEKNTVLYWGKYIACFKALLTSTTICNHCGLIN